MTRSLSKLSSLVLVTILILSMGASGTAGATTTAGNDATTVETFAVHQGDSCYEATALGDGSQTVESFYNYSVDFDYSSEGTTHLQKNQVSNLFVYNGSKGYSLVFLHDEHGDGPYGSTITFDVTGLPEDGDWAVEDDSYGNDTDDNFDHYGTRSEIDWMWAPGRTDGGAFRGLTAEKDVEITIEPGFNERADEWGNWPYSGDDTNRTESWRLLDEDGTTVTQLVMTENVTVETGPCDQTPPSSSLSVNNSDVTVGQSVEFDASASTDDQEIVEYRWDFDGDGSVDERTESSTTAHAYASADEYDATVTVADATGNQDTANTTINVTADDSDTEPPTAVLDAPKEVGVSANVTFNASASTDDQGIVEYRWDFDGDGKVDRTTTTATTVSSYENAGEYDSTVTVADAGGNTDTANTTINVTADDTDPPTAALEAPSEAVVNQSVTFDASGSTDDTEIVEYRWDFDGDGTVDERTGSSTATHAYASAGEYDATVTVTDAADNEDTANATIDVMADASDETDASNETDTEPPTATLIVPDEVTANESFTVKATNITDESDIAHVCWYYDGKVGPDGKTMTLSFAEPGDHTVSLRVKDSANNDRKITRTVTVVAATETDAPDHSDDSDDSNADDGDSSDDSSENDQSDDEDDTSERTDETDTRMPDISLQTVQVSDETVTPGEAVEFTVILTNSGDSTGSHVVNLSVGGPAANESNVSASREVTLSAGEERTVTFSKSFDESGEYDVHLADRNATVSVTEPETPQQSESPSDTPTEEDSDTPTEMDSDTPAEPAQNESQEDASMPTSGTGPGFGSLSVIIAAVLGVVALFRRR